MATVTATEDDILPWPECLGMFDEESCRFFLRELGQKVVQAYPFSVGMEEVFNSIVEHYGFQGSADALGVLQELLEDESTAAGAGDDGDIWRSWRHNWRHRNDNAHNPYLPRAHGRLLPSATPTRIRLLKTANYITHQLMLKNGQPLQAPPSMLFYDESVAGYERLSFKSFHVPLATPMHHAHDICDMLHKRSEQDINNVENCKHAQRENCTSKQSSEEEWLGLSLMRKIPSIDSDVLASPRKSMPAPSRRHHFPFDLVSPKRITLAKVSTLHHDQNRSNSKSIVSATKQEQKEGHSLNREECDSCSPVTDINIAKVNEDPEKTPLSQRLLKFAENRYSLPSSLGPVDIEATPSNKRVAHRQARMIDGALFQGKTRKEIYVDNHSTSTPSPVKAAAEASSRRLSWHSPKRSPRQSWLHNVLMRFHSKQIRKSKQPKARKHHSGLGGCGINELQYSRDDMPIDQESTTPHEPETRPATSRMDFGFDGVNDDRNNKPLPLSPAQQRYTPSLQSETQRIFFDRSTDEDGINSSLHSAHSYVFHLRDKGDLRSLVSATMSGPHELSSKDSDLNYRYSSSSSLTAPASPKSFTTLARSNPYHDLNEPPTCVETPVPLVHHDNEISSAVWPFRHSPVQSHTTEQSPSDRSKEAESIDRENASMSQHNTGAGDADVDRRGRTFMTPPTSPLRSTNNSRATPPSKAPPVRSRSPVKKLIGMVKSMSTNQLPNEPPSSKPDTSTNTNQGRWKELSHKLRHGFLTADLEQLDKEALMDQYTSENRKNEAVRMITPPSNHERTNFPVSIKSSGQSKLWSELEYMLIETSNQFLKDELASNRISRDSVLKIKRQWQARNRPQVVEFYYDQATQYDLVIANLRTVRLYSDYCQDAIMLNSVLHQWKILIRELSVKTLCMPDSIVRRWLHDGRRVLELLGASQITLTNMDKLSTLCTAVIGSAEKERAKRRHRDKVTDTQGNHRRSVSDSSTTTLYKHEQALLRARQPTPPSVPPMFLAASGRRVMYPEASQQQLRRPHAQTQAHHQSSNSVANQFVFTHGGGSNYNHSHGHKHSKSLTPAPERSRFQFD